MSECIIEILLRWMQCASETIGGWFIGALKLNEPWTANQEKFFVWYFSCFLFLCLSPSNNPFQKIKKNFFGSVGIFIKIYCYNFPRRIFV